MAGWVNVCRFVPAAGGTTDWTYSSFVVGYQSPALANIVNGTLYKHRAESADLSQWEISEGAYNTGTNVLARTTVLYNSAGTGTRQSGAGSKINFTTMPQVAIVALPEDLIAVAATRTILKALDTSTTTVAMLTEAGREGMFVWRTGDHSAQITADTLEGGYLKATAIASTVGGWERVRGAGGWALKWFGTLGTADDSSVFNAAMTTVAALGGGRIGIGQGNFNIISGITVPSLVTPYGEGELVTQLIAWHTDVLAVTVSGNFGGMENLSIYGKGTNADTGTFGAVNNAVLVSGNENHFKNVTITGGAFPLYVTGTDNTFEDVDHSYGYSYANLAAVGANWHIRCKHNHYTTSIALTDPFPGTAWAAGEAVTVGRVRQVSVAGTPYAMVCSGAGTTNATTAPTLKNYGIPFTDGTATWLLLAAANYSAVYVGGTGENHFLECDTSGTYSAALTFVGGVNTFTNGVIASKVNISGSTVALISANELGGDIALLSGFTGVANINGNVTYPGDVVNVNVAANVSNFIVAGNILNGGTITVTAGTSNHYNITNNVNATIVDGGTGTDKKVDGLLIGAVKTRIITASVTYTPSAGLLFAKFRAAGGGAGSGGATSGATNAGGGGGGGGGEYAELLTTAAIIGASQAVTIAAGGTAGASGNNPGGDGGDTSVGTLCIAKGGKAGAGSPGGAQAAGGLGGTGGTGDYKIPGERGGTSPTLLSITIISMVSGRGGASFFGMGQASVVATTQTAGIAGNNYGGGASGGVSWGAGGNAAGAAGAPGLVEVTEYCSKP